MATVATARGAIGYSEAGDGGEPLLFLHGVGSDKSVWRPQLEHFGRERRTIAFDYPGYGESEFQAGATREDFARSILGAMSALDIPRAHICGLSLGGVIAITMHSIATERCASLILADTFACHPEGQAIHDRSLAASRELGLRGLAESRVAALVAAGASQQLRDEIVETMARIDPAAYELGAAAVWLADQRRQVRDIRCPTLVICGTEDRITPPSLIEDLKLRIPGASLVEIAGAGHLANAEMPQVFNRVIDGFLAGVES